MSLRDQIKMSKEEITTFLQNQISLQIGTINKWQSPFVNNVVFL
jgi:hypothetical protein